VVVRQIQPDGKLNAISCKEQEKSCVLNVRLATENDASLKVHVLIISGEAYFKFELGEDLLEGDNLEHYYIPLAINKSVQKQVTLYPQAQYRADDRDSLHQSPVLRYSLNSIVKLEITMVPKAHED
jgi:hypothetical protein